MKKRIIGLMLAFLMVLAVLPMDGITVFAATVEYPVTGGSIYFDTQTGMITGYSGNVTDIEIPAMIDGVKVTGIDDNAFNACYSLTSIVIPEGVTTIGEAAFYTCENLNSITIPQSITAIGDSAFYFCRGLTSITIPEGVTTISAWTFGHCYGLESIMIPDGVTAIEASAFFSCESLTSVTIPKGVTSIGDAAFSWCRFMTDITIPEGITTIGAHAFSYCYSLKSVTIPDGVTTIGDNAFSYGYELTSVTIPASVTKIGDTAFEYCGSPMDIYYTGSQTQWMDMDKGNNDFSNITVHYSISCEHDYEAVETEPTCIDSGYTTYTCPLCEDTYVDAYVAALGHDTTDHEAQAAACTERGWDAYETCSRCDYSSYKEIPALGHDKLNHAAQSATCTESGWEAYETCSRCDYSTYKEIAALGHDKVSHEAQTPSCIEAGWDAYETCSRCDYTTYKEVPALDHEYADGICTRCGAEDPNYEKPGHICPSIIFSDVPAVGNWAHDGIDYCVEHELMNGTGGKLFDPDGTVSRAQLVTILYRVAGSPATEFKGTFKDVPGGQWYSDAIEWAAANGVVNGIGDDKFGPDQSITREQIATILHRYEGTPQVTGNLDAFPDKGSVSSFAVNGLIWATQKGLINGVNSNGVTTLAPKNNATRAQIASIIMRYLAE